MWTIDTVNILNKLLIDDTEFKYEFVVHRFLTENGEIAGKVEDEKKIVNRRKMLSI